MSFSSLEGKKFLWCPSVLVFPLHSNFSTREGATLFDPFGDPFRLGPAHIPLSSVELPAGMATLLPGVLRPWCMLRGHSLWASGKLVEEADWKFWGSPGNLFDT